MNRAALPLVSAILALGLAVNSGPEFLRVVGGLSLLLFVPGFAISVALFGPERSAGDTVLVSLAASIAVTGIGGLVLGLAHAFNRPEIIAVDATVSLASAIVAAWRFRRDSRPDRPSGRIGTRITVVTGTVLGIAILVAAFAIDATSATHELRETSVALSAARHGGTLGIEVIAPGNASFSGTVELKRASTVLQTWTVERLPAGRRWTPSHPVPIGNGSGPLQLTLSHDGSQVRAMDILLPPSHPRRST
jgi:Protein of unknown function (DUF1616)